MPPTEHTTVNNFVGTFAMKLTSFLKKKITEKQNLSNKEKKALNIWFKNRNVKVCVDDTDKNLGPISTDKDNVIKECRRQLYGIITYNKISWSETQNIISKIKNDLRVIVKKRKKDLVLIMRKSFFYQK